ncbi:hypothetical protein K432DRAFT_431872 [Lepidopterella palustris CBS 459.81]|uniref:Zn(2)-C6 fungal-type domain-containing protein n=1 Tax=Lepidopterella palustris CBS 459.81 TaxID=1314670 RepID=A0A8E2JJR7_9PEZI|nr:hypothetical protein K432DRAFT_431872 [Lepidopterella palustris CBS 459.81]
MFFVEGSMLEESQEVKRKRISTACHMCQKRKTKCDGNMPACTQCIRYKTNCVFTQTKKKRGPRKGSNYMKALEERLVKMESLLNLTGALVKKDIGKTDPIVLGTQPAETTHETTSSIAPATAISPADSSDGTPTLEDTATEPHSPYTFQSSSNRIKTADSHTTNQTTEPQSIGSSVGYSMFSPKCIQCLIEKTGNTTFKDAIYAASLDETKMDYRKSLAISNIFTRPVFRQLPPKEETLSIVKMFFKDFNSVCPLFYEPEFMTFLERQYSQNPYNGVGWWASLNVVLAITLGLQAVNHAPLDVIEKAWDYLRNALAVLTELTVQSTDLFSVQALLGMALFMQRTADPRPTAFLIASAIRLSHNLGLHRNESGYNVDPREAEQRKRVFWIAYRIDKDTCIRSGLPLIQDDDDMNVDLPSRNPEDELGSISLDGQGKANIFRLMAEFALIEARVYKELYSAKASKKSDEELLITIGELDRQLEAWKESIPINFQPEYEIKVVDTSLRLHIIVLHFAYYNCLISIHRKSVHHSYWTSRSSNFISQGLDASLLSPRVFASAALCSSAARASIRLIRYIPVQDSGFVWRVLYFPVSAIITLFAGILDMPTDPYAHSDLRLIGSFVNFLSKLQQKGTGEENRIFRVCLEFERIAKDVVDNAGNGSYLRKDQKRTAQDVDKGKQLSTSQYSLPPTPESVVLGNSGLPYISSRMHSSATPWNHLPALDESGTGSDQFTQQFLGTIGGTQNPYADVQAMFPNGLTMPWNGNTLHSLFASESLSTSPYDFGVGQADELSRHCGPYMEDLCSVNPLVGKSKES